MKTSNYWTTLYARLLGVAFLCVGVAVFFAKPDYLNVLSDISLSPWMQYLIATMTVIGSIAMCFQRTSFYAMVLSGLLMCCVAVFLSIYNPLSSALVPGLLIMFTLIGSYGLKNSG